MDEPRDTRLHALWRRILLAAGVLMLAALIYAVHRWTVAWAAPELIAARERVEFLEQEVIRIRREAERPTARLAVAEQNAEILHHAVQLLREEESTRQQELRRLQAELDFFRRLAGTSGAQDGLSVYHLGLKPTASARVFRFVLTLTQNLQRSAITAGSVRFDMEGTLGDRPATLPWAQFSQEGAPEPTFRFKYFQQLDGYMVVPADFNPTRLVVSLDVKGQAKPIVRGFDWQRLLQPDGDNIALQGDSLQQQGDVPEPQTQ